MMTNLIDFPQLNEVTAEYASEFLVDFYKALGWDPEQMDLDAKLVTINHDRWIELCEAFQQAGNGGGFFWMNYGPAASVHVPYKSVKLDPGYISQPDSSEKPMSS